MLRTLLLLLLLANAAVFAWTHGWLDPLVPPPGSTEREPARLAAQVNADAVRVVPASPRGAQQEAAPRAATRCLEIGPFGLVDAAQAEATLEAAGLAAGTWERDLREPGQMWLRVPRADAVLRERLQALAAGAPVLAAGFKPCSGVS
ncbi:MAG: hypothetical protein JNL30_16490 [Rubrivivax sp.]|nr:hypothetical protein [Rubrivivax sp.]